MPLDKLWKIIPVNPIIYLESQHFLLQKRDKIISSLLMGIAAAAFVSTTVLSVLESDDFINKK